MAKVVPSEFIERFTTSALSYAIATLGPISTAVTQFALSLYVLRSLDAGSFGSFSFLLVISALSCGVWSALFCAPLPVILSHFEISDKKLALCALFTTSALGSTLAFPAFFLLGRALDLASHDASFFGLYGALTLLRWFARQYCYSNHAVARAAISDLVYSAAIVIGMASLPKNAPFQILLIAACSSLVPFGRFFFVPQIESFRLSGLKFYPTIWSRYSGWSLLGVVTTEITANSHAYLVTMVLGAAAFAPLSASALLIRPVGVVMNALTDFERPRLAQRIRSGDILGVKRLLLIFRCVLIATWLFTALAGVGLILYAPQLVFPSRYSLQEISEGTAIWLAIAAMRLLRMPESALLQAAGVFRALAMASVISSAASILSVAILLAISGAVSSLIGILIGEGMYAFWVHRRVRNWFDTVDSRRLESLEQTQAELSN